MLLIIYKYERTKNNHIYTLCILFCLCCFSILWYKEFWIIFFLSLLFYNFWIYSNELRDFKATRSFIWCLSLGVIENFNQNNYLTIKKNRFYWSLRFFVFFAHPTLLFIQKFFPKCKFLFVVFETCQFFF